MSVLLAPEQNEEVRELVNEATTIERAAVALIIKDDDSMKEASNMLGIIASAKKNLEKHRKFFVQPLNDQVKRINLWFKGRMEPLEKADGTIRSKVLVFRQEQERRRREEEERLRKLAQKEQKRLEKQAIKKGEPAPPPIPVPIIPEQSKSVHGDFGTVSAKKVWDFEVLDEMKIPREFLMVNEKAVRAAVKAGVRNIPGVRVFQREELAVKGR